MIPLPQVGLNRALGLRGNAALFALMDLEQSVRARLYEACLLFDQEDAASGTRDDKVDFAEHAEAPLDTSPVNAVEHVEMYRKAVRQ